MTVLVKLALFIAAVVTGTAMTQWAEKITPTPTTTTTIAPVTTTVPITLPPIPTTTTTVTATIPGPTTKYLASDQVVAVPCSVSVPYEEAHAQPGTAVVCPAALPHGIIALTTLDGGQVTIQLKAEECWNSVRNEASNSYIIKDAGNVHYTSHGLVDGRRIDPYGECQ